MKCSRQEDYASTKRLRIKKDYLLLQVVAEVLQLRRLLLQIVDLAQWLVDTSSASTRDAGNQFPEHHATSPHSQTLIHCRNVNKTHIKCSCTPLNIRRVKERRASFKPVSLVFSMCSKFSK